MAVCAGPAASASADRSFSARYQAHTRGDLATAANTLLSCPTGAAGCDAARAGTGGSRQNNNWAMGYVDVDGDPATFDSSSATLSLPAGAEVTFAGLYWGADTTAGSGGAAAPAAAFASTALLDTPEAGGYQPVTGSQHDLSSTWPDRYQEFADVTAQVAAAGAGDYTLANVQAGTGSDRYAGWTLVVAYRAAGEPIRNLTVFDGLVTVEGSSSASLTLDGFEAPGTGTVQTNLGLATYEGDYGISGDSVALNGTTLTDAANPAANLFNSTIAAGGTRVTAKSPDYVDQLGFDSDQFAVDGLIPAGATSAAVQLATSGDTYFVGVVTLSSDQIPELPSNDAAPSVSGTAEDGQTLTAGSGSWSGTGPFDFAYQWVRCDAAGANCTDIAGATDQTYQLVDEDAGNTVRVVVTASNEVGSESATSDASAIVAAVAPSDTAAPTISGPQRAGDTLTADQGTWSGTGPLAYSYQWRRCDAGGGNCVDIPGATGSTYELTTDDVGSTVLVLVTVTNPAGSDSVASAPSAPVAAPAQVDTPPVDESAPTSPGEGGGDAESGRAPAPGAGTADLALLPDSTIAPPSCQQVTGSQVLAFKVPGWRIRGGTRFRIRVAPSGYITDARPLRAASPVPAASAWKLTRHLKRVEYRLGGRRLATRRLAPYAVRIGPRRLSRGARQTLTVRVVPKRGKPRVARVQLNSRPCSELFTVVHRPSPSRSLLGLRVDSVKPLRGVVFRVPVGLLVKPGSRGVAGKLRVRVAGRRSMNFRLAFPRRKGRATTLLAGAGRPRVSVSGGKITVSGLPAGTGGIRLRLKARGMLTTPRARLRALVQSDGASRRLTQRLGRAPARR